MKRLTAACCVVAIVGLSACSRVDEKALSASAAQRLEQRDFVGAALDARTLLQDKPESAVGRYLLGRTLLAGGEVGPAETEFERAEKFGLPEPQLFPALAELLLAQDKPALVIERFADTRFSDMRATSQLQLQVARARSRAGDRQAADATLQALLAQDPSFGPAHVLQARWLAEQGSGDAAMAATKSWLETDPKDADAWVLQGDLLTNARADAALIAAAYRQALALQPRIVEAHAGLIGVLLQQKDLAAAATQAAAMAKALPREPTTRYYRALVAYARGEYGQARELLQPLQRRSDDQAPLLLLLGMTELRLGGWAQAEAALTRAMQLQPDAVDPRRELAALYVRQGQAERALAVLQPALAQHADDAQLLAISGQAQVLKGDYAGADRDFKRATQLRPADANIKIQIGRALVARGDTDLGLRELQSAADADPSGVAADLQLVGVQMGRQDSAAALKVVEGMARKQPGQALPEHVRGRILQSKGDIPAARRAYEQAVANDPRFLPAISSLADLDLADQNLDAARARYEALLKLDPRSSASMLALAVITRRAGGSREDAAKWLDRAVAANPQDVLVWRSAIDHHRREGDDASALARARSAIAAVPDDPDLLLDLALAQLRSHDVQQALSALSRVAQQRPGSPEIQLRLAEAQLMVKNVDAARGHIKQALQLAPSWPPALRSAIALAFTDQQPARALALAREVQARAPQAALGWQLEGEVELQARHAAAAVAALRTALGKGESTELAILLHRALRADAAGAQAMPFEQQWLKAHPGDAGFLTYLAEQALADGNARSAETLFGRAAALQPGDVSLLNNLAYLQAQRKDAQALGTARKALKLAPYLPQVMDTLAYALAQAGQLDEAIDWQARAADLQPQDGGLRLRLARLYLGADKKDKARIELGRLTATGTTFPERPEAEALLRQLGG